jgi:amino acid adenylation domain-containing protein/non-ribosomal peptide synthase protein (TIGR01720 family)
MSIEDYISQLRRKHGIHLSWEKGELKVRATQKNPDQQVLTELRARKEEVVSFFKSLEPGEKGIPVVEDQEYYVASSAQRRLFFVQEMDRQSTAYNLPRAVCISGPLNEARLKSTFDSLVKRHESLRTLFFVKEGQVFQKINEPAEVTVNIIQTSEAEVMKRIQAFIRPFDLEKGPLLRVALLQTDAHEHVLLVDMHHIISDGFSQGILIKEFVALYQKEQLDPLPLQYRDFATWQNQKEQEEESAARHFWLKEFAEEPETLELPTDFARPKVKQNQGASVGFQLSAEHTAGLRAIADAEETTLFMVLLTAYKVLLSKLSGQEDIVVGTPVAGRQQAELEQIIGMFANTLPLRSAVDGNLSFRDLLHQVKDKTLAAFSHQAVQYEALISELQVARNTSHNPLFDVMFTYLDFEESPLELPDLRIDPLNFNQSVSKFDLTLKVEKVRQSVALSFEYATTLFSEGTVNKFAAYFKALVAAIVQEPLEAVGNVSVLSDSEIHQQVCQFNSTEVLYPDQETIVSLFQKQVGKNPDQAAVLFEDEGLTFKQLDELSNQIAHYLINQGIEPGQMVGIMLEREAFLIPSIYGILKAGAAYVPIAPHFPTERIQTISQSAQLKAVITRREHDQVSEWVGCLPIDLNLAEKEIHQQPVSTPQVTTDSNDLAYVIYTSGSTGKPKGVMIEHQAVINRILWMQNTYPLHELDVILQKTPIVFDVSVWELFWWAFTGASVCLLRPGGEKEPAEIIRTVDRYKVTTMHFVPSMLSIFLAVLNKDYTLDSLASLKRVFTSGEALKTDHVRLFGALLNKAHKTRLINLYGPTEATVDVSYYECDFEETENPPIGKPVDNTSLHILSKYQTLQPIGVPGELHIGGVQLARGYVGDPVQTEEKFIADHISGSGRLYKTGDLVKWLPDGNMAYLGRIDHQVKLRGFRIELGEIESQLQNHHQVQEVVIMVRERDADKVLVAYYVSDEAITERDLRDHLTSKLPAYMVPGFFVHLHEMPFTPTGKINRKALPEPELNLTKAHVAPASDLEKELVAIWSDVLGLNQLGVTDNFFSAGGDSIKSIQIGSRLRSIGFDVTVQDIFTHQTVRQLAANLRTLVVTSDQSLVEGEGKLSPIQHWFFEGPVRNKSHFNQSVLLRFPAGISAEVTEQIFTKVQEHHDALRMSFHQQGNSWVQQNHGPDFPLSLQKYDLRGESDASERLEKHAQAIQESIDIVDGPLMKLGLFQMTTGTRLLIVIHHLVTDGLSWRILFEDMATLYHQMQLQTELKLPLKTDAYLHWPEKLTAYTRTKQYQEAKAWWQDFAQQQMPVIADENARLTGQKGVKRASFLLNRELTDSLLTRAHEPFYTQINDLLLAALLSAVKKQFNEEKLLIALEGHGRESIDKHVNISRTIGWFTSIYPVLLSSRSTGMTGLIKEVKEELRSVPNKGFDYLLYQLLEPQDKDAQIRPQIIFNYLGQFDSDMKNLPFELADESHGSSQSKEEELLYDLDITGVVREGQLEMSLRYQAEKFSKDTISQLMQGYEESLAELISHCVQHEGREKTPADLTWKQLSLRELEELQQEASLTDVYPLSPMQEGMLFHQMMADASANYVGQITCQISGALDLVAIEQSMNKLMQRHDVLRTRFVHEGYTRPLQVVLEQSKIDFRFEDIRSVEDISSKQRLVRMKQGEEKHKGFDLANEVLMRLLVLQTEDRQFEFIWSHHHILMDGWCMGMLIQEFQVIYLAELANKQIDLPEIKPYANYIQWLESGDKEGSAQFWEQYLLGYDNQATLPQKDNLLAEALPYDLQSSFIQLSQEQTEKLNALSARYGITLNTIFQLAWAVLLSRYNNTHDIVFGSVVSGRPAELEGVESMVGLFINTVPVRIEAEGNQQIADLLQSTQARALECERHHYHPLSEIQSLSQLSNELINHILVFENFPIAGQIGAGTAENVEQPFEIANGAYTVQTNYDLSVKVYLQQALQIQLDFNANVYDEYRLNEIGSYLRHILLGIADHPTGLIKDLQLSDARQRAAFNQSVTTDLTLDKQLPSVQQQLEKAAQTFGDRIAISSEAGEYTYSHLHTRANKVANRLANSQLLEGACVGIFCEDRYKLVVAVIGILKARLTFVPLETGLPQARLLSMIEQTAIDHIITDQPKTIQDELFAEEALQWITWDALEKITNTEYPLRTDYQENDPVYVYFTSGSTGQPKGVKGRNKGLAHFIDWEINQFDIDADFRFSQFTNPGFDVFMRDVLVPLCAGATICVPSDEHLSTGQDIHKWLEEQEISFVHCVPSFFRLFNQAALHAGALTSLRYILLAGEKIAPFELKSWYQRFKDSIQLVNIYGPTETTLAKGFYLIQPQDAERNYIPVKAIPGAQFLILDQHLNHCPTAAIGEIYIRTPYQSLGYLPKSQVAENPFIQSPFPEKEGELLYKTGDLGKRAENGEIEILGRLDHQVKIRGIRIELDDIKENLLSHPAIDDAVVIARTDDWGDKYICAYIISDTSPDQVEIRDYLSARLPGNMVPSYLTQLDELPLLPNGKINRRALPEPAFSTSGQERIPTSETEQKLAAIWAEVLRIDSAAIGIDQSFFDVGGHSIRAVSLINKLREAFGVKILLRDVFEHNTIEAQAALVATTATEDEVTSIPRVESRQDYPASPAQERMYYQHLLHEESTAFNISVPIIIRHKVDLERITRAFQQVIDRHEGLRTSFHLTDNGVVQRINKADFKLEFLTAQPDKDTQEMFRDFIRPFDLSAPSLFRVGLLHLEEEGDYLFVDMHHIVCDGASLNILVNDFKKSYQGQELEPLPLRYIDYACWIAEEKNTLQKQQEFWMQKLSGELPRLGLEAGMGENTRKTSSSLLTLGSEANDQLKQVMARNQASEFMVLLSACYVFLSKISGQSDILIGTDGLGRTRPGLEEVIGTFVNVLPLRLYVDEELTVRELLTQVRTCLLEAFDNQDFQFNEMVSLLRKEQRLGDEELIEFHCSVANVLEEHAIDGLSYALLQSKRNEVAEYGFRIEGRLNNNQLSLVFIYNNSLYEEETVQVFIAYYHSILLQILKDESVSVADINMDLLLEEMT